MPGMSPISASTPIRHPPGSGIELSRNQARERKRRKRSDVAGSNGGSGDGMLPTPDRRGAVPLHGTKPQRPPQSLANLRPRACLSRLSRIHHVAPLEHAMRAGTRGCLETFGISPELDMLLPA